MASAAYPAWFGNRSVFPIIKAVSWRITGSVDPFVISLLVTGKIGVAGAIASAEVITKIALYYFHERVWALIPWGR